MENLTTENLNTESAPPIFTLPTEILIQFALFLNSSQDSLRALSLTCRQFADIAQRVLFQSITCLASRPYQPDVVDPSIRLRPLIDSSKDLLTHVRRLALVHEIFEASRLSEEKVAQLMMDLVRSTPNIRYLNLAIHLQSKLVPLILEGLQGRNLTTLSLRILPMVPLNLDDLSGPPLTVSCLALTQYTIYGGRPSRGSLDTAYLYVSTVIQRCQSSLVTLNIHGDVRHLCRYLAKNPLPKLEYLSITFNLDDDVGDELVQMLLVHPTITSLTVPAKIPSSLFALSESTNKTLLPRLTAINASMETAAHLVSGRSVTSLGSWFVEEEDLLGVERALKQLKSSQTLTDLNIGALRTLEFVQHAFYIVKLQNLESMCITFHDEV